MNKIKRLFIICCVTITSLMLTSTVFAETEYEYDEASVAEQVSAIVGQILLMDETELEYYMENSIGWTKEACEDIYSYKNNGTLGEMVSAERPVIEEEGHNLKVSMTVHYENADLLVTTYLTEIVGSLNVYEIDFKMVDTGDKSLGEKMTSAAFNAFIGIVSVFIVLLIICFVISLFKYIPKIQNLFDKREVEHEETIDNVIAQIEEKEELVDDTEIVAVITAAICAATGSSADGFVVRSIKKADRKKRRISN